MPVERQKRAIRLTVPKWDRARQGNYIELGNNKVITFLSGDAAFAVDKLAIGDLVLKVNMKSKLNEIEFENILHASGDVVVELERPANVNPVNIVQLAALNLKRRPQFGYIHLTIGSEEMKGQSLGIVAKAKTQRIYVLKVARGSVAEESGLLPGDGLADLNGTVVPDDTNEAVIRMEELMKTYGMFTSVVERPIHEHFAREMLRDLTKQPHLERRKMPDDAKEIGCRAAREFLKEHKDFKPKPIFSAPAPKSELKSSKKSSKDDTKKRDKRIEYAEEVATVQPIGTSFAGETEKLQKATRNGDDKSLRTIPRVRAPFFDDFYDVL